jgi:hypothetical protein
MGILWIMQRMGRARTENWVKLASLPIISLISLAVLLGILFVDPVLAASKNWPIQFFGAFASKADVQAMLWLKQNTGEDEIILNYPGEQEGHWVPIIAQRNTIYFRPQPFFRGTEKVEAVQNALLRFWKAPPNPLNAGLLERYRIAYVIVPQLITRPETIQGMFRWRQPIPEALACQQPHNKS